MVKVRVRPARGAVLRALLATVEITFGVTLAHTLAGGELPGVSWLAALTVLVFAGSLLIVRGRASLWAMVPVLTGTQFVLHALLASAPTSGHATHHAAHHASQGSHLDLSWQMVLAHAATAVLTAVVWRVRRGLVEALVTWSSVPPSLVVRQRGDRPLVRDHAPRSILCLVGAPRRGPPRMVRCA